MKASNRALAVAAPALFVVLWASGFAVARLTAGHVEPVSFLAFRFPLAALCMLALAIAFGQKPMSARDAVRAAGVGVFLHALYLACVYWAVAHGLPGGVSALIGGLQPLLTAFMAAPLLHERIDAKHWVSLAIGMAGVALVLSPKFSWAALGGITPITAGVAFLGIVAAAFGTVYQKRIALQAPLLMSMFWQYVGASAVVIVIAAATENFGFDGSPAAWAALFWAVLGLSVINILILLYMIRKGEVAKVSMLIFLVPGVAALMTYAMFDETLTLIQMAGMAVTAAAVMIVNLKSKSA
jgi:drug/metabolite transporter (DMT)-like permease